MDCADAGAREDGESGGDGPISTRPPRQSTQLKKCECRKCGYTVRVTQKWLDIGPPHCSQHGAMDTPQRREALQFSPSALRRGHNHAQEA